MAQFIFFRFLSLFLFSVPYVRNAKENCPGSRKNLKFCLYTISIIIKSIGVNLYAVQSIDENAGNFNQKANISKRTLKK